MAVDDHSRLAFVEVHPDEKGATSAGFLERAAAFMASHGAPVKRVITSKLPRLWRTSLKRDTDSGIPLPELSAAGGPEVSTLQGTRCTSMRSAGSGTAKVIVTVQIRAGSGEIDGWETAGQELASVLSDEAEGFEENLLWRGAVTLPADRVPGTFRLLVTEEETWIARHQANTVVSRLSLTPRFVYAEHLPL